ncbi:MAG: hypothetical protein ACI9O6_000908 [Glaciecola sp.]|jgi:hypothetical protein
MGIKLITAPSHFTVSLREINKTQIDPARCSKDFWIFIIFSDVVKNTRALKVDDAIGDNIC